VENNHKFVCLEDLDKYETVYDLEVQDHHNYIAGEICAHNCNRPSLQVWPRPVKGIPNIRNVIIPSEGMVLFEADYKALEQFVVAVLSKDVTLTKRLQDGTDIHTFNAIELGKYLGTVPDELSYDQMLSMVKDFEETTYTKEEYEQFRNEAQEVLPDYDWKELRTRAKSIGFGLNYGKGEHAFAEEFGIEEDEAEDMIEGYFNIYKGMKKWRDNTVRQALEEGYVTLLSGRKRRFTQATRWLNSKYAKDVWQAKKLKEEISRQAMNAPVQGGAHDVFEPAKIRFINRLKKEGIKANLLLSIHDGIVGECNPEDVTRVLQIMKEELPTTFNKGTKYELNLDIDMDVYEHEWYGKKQKITFD
jgi:DNA polymerase-1